MNDFSVPTHLKSTSTDAGMTLSDLIADHTATTGGTLQQPHST